MKSRVPTLNPEELFTLLEKRDGLVYREIEVE
jgi:hypothetical protein